jgi:hypothetical protein
VQAATGGIAVTIQGDPHEGPEDHWTDLVAAVNEADRFGLDLTLLLSPNWASYISESPIRLRIAAKWVRDDGHQIGFHHHDVTSPHPDVYCAVDESDWLPGWRGSSWAKSCEPYLDETVGYDAVEELHALLQAAPYNVPSSEFTDANIACQGPEEAMRSLEWQPQVVFSQGNQSDGTNDASIPGQGTLSGVSCQSYGGQDVPEIGSSWINPGTSLTTVADILSDLANSTASDHDYVSVTFHPEEFTGAAKMGYRALFAGIRATRGGTLLMTEILVAEDPCAGS